MIKKAKLAKRTPNCYYTIEFIDFVAGTIDDAKSLEVMKHDNIWGEEIFDIRESVDNYNFFLTKTEATKSLKAINKIFYGKWK